MPLSIGLLAICSRAMELGIKHPTLTFHGVSFVDAAELMTAGYRPHCNTVRRDGKWSTYYDLSARVAGVNVSAFTEHRPALEREIDDATGFGVQS
jgi:hypothetical protein